MALFWQQLTFLITTGILNCNWQVVTTGISDVATGIIISPTGIIMSATGILNCNWQLATRNSQLTTGNWRNSKSPNNRQTRRACVQTCTETSAQMDTIDTPKP